MDNIIFGNSPETYIVNSGDSIGRKDFVQVKLNDYDNNIRHFASTLLTTLAIWDLPLMQFWHQKGDACIFDERQNFLSQLRKAAEKKPLNLMFTRTNLITNSRIHEFFKQLLKIGNTYLTIQLHYEFQKNPVFINYTLLDNEAQYLTFEEEKRVYEQAGYVLEDALCQELRNYTDGWIAAVNVMLNFLELNGLHTFSTKKKDYGLWLFSQVTKAYTQPEVERLLCYSLLKEFPQELISSLAGWDGETLHTYLINNPIIRFNPVTRQYYYANHLEPLLKDKLLLLSNQIKEDFCLNVANWYENHEDKLNAIRIYRKVDAWSKIYQIMVQWTFPNSRETANCYIDIISEMPASFLDSHPRLHVIKAHMLNTLYRYKDCFSILQDFCCSYLKEENLTEDIQTVLGEAFLLMGHCHLCSNVGFEQALSFYQKAADYLPHGSSMIPKKMNLFADAPVIHLPNQEAGSFQNSMNNLVHLEPYLVHCANGGWSGCSDLAKAEYNYYIWNLKEVDSYAHKAIEAALQKEQYDVACSACFLMMRLYFARGRYDKLMQSLKLLKQYASEAKYDTFFSMPDLAESWLNLKLNKNQEIAYWLKDESVYQKIIMPWNYGRDRIIRAIYLLNNQFYEELIAHCQSTETLFCARHYHLLNIELLMIEAIAYHQNAEPEKSIEKFTQVYKWCDKNKIVMPVVEYGSHVRALINNCRKFPDCQIDDNWLDYIRSKAHTYAIYQYNIRKAHGSQNNSATVLSALTTTELRTLWMICQGVSIRQIAREQYKSYEAIRSTLKRIYLKINASNRADAIRIATMHNIEKYI